MSTAIIGAIAFICFFGFMFPIVRVLGDSMLPTYHDREILFSMRMIRFMPLYEGMVYVYTAPDGKTVIKRLICQEDGLCYFLGDNPSVSHDSRSYGYIDRKNIIAIVL